MLVFLVHRFDEAELVGSNLGPLLYKLNMILTKPQFKNAAMKRNLIHVSGG